MKLLVRKFLLSPLVHFFAIGAAIFAAYSILEEAPPPMARDEITVTPQEAERLASQFSATWRREPTRAELENLFHAWALEEAYVREALKLGLDRDDRVIRQRLAMKVQFLAESGAGALLADDATLQAFLDANPERFEQPAQIAFDQVLLSAGASAEEINRALVALQDGADPMTVGRSGLLPASVPIAPISVIDRQFGDGFHAGLATLPLGRWEGPLRSPYGLHLVQVNDRSPARLPSLAEVRQRVEAEWRITQTQQMREAFGEALLKRYTVSYPDITQAEVR